MQRWDAFAGWRRRRSDKPLLERPTGSQSKHQHRHHHSYNLTIIPKINQWINFPSFYIYIFYIRAEWKIQKLHFSKSERNFRTTSQHWFQNCFWNHDWTIILLRNLAKISYRIQRQIWNHDGSRFQVISLKIGIETMFLQTTSQPWLQNSFWIHDPTLCLLSNSGNVFYRKHWVYSFTL